MMQRLIAISLLLFSSFAITAELPDDQEAEQPNPSIELKERLLDVQSTLVERRSIQSRLQKELNKKANSSDAGELTLRLEAVNKDISSLKKTFEHLAVGGADLDSIGGEPKEFNWQEEMTLVTRPLFDTLKSLTEKPRKIEELKNAIELNQVKQRIIEKALASLETNFSDETPKALKTTLDEIKVRWEQRLSDNNREAELANFQLATLQGINISWYETVRDTSKDFIKGRGLTLLIALLASMTVWMFTRFLLWVVKWLQRGKTSKKSLKLHYRLASYGFTLLTTLLIITSVIVVFYVRGDILMLALSLLLLAVTILGMRNFLPQYLAEAKLLLNIGAIRDGERTVYNGLPWEVCTINIYSILRNPELEGVVRLPIAALRDMISRPCRGEAWFPSSKGDFVLLPDSLLAEVVRQTPEMVYLKVKGGMHYNLPASDFFGLGVFNLTRGESFVITTVFGIDYEHQDIALSQVPNAFQAALQDAFKSEGFDDHLNEVAVELKSAGASSLDYLIIINVKPTAAPLYFKLERLLQRSCIQVCSEHGWGIPFPQITVHQALSGNEQPKLPYSAVE